MANKNTKNIKKSKSNYIKKDKTDSDSMNIQWYPGHMTKTRRMIEEDIKIVDAVAEMVDARCPEASRNPILNDLLKNKPRIVILNKCDYADDTMTGKWQEYYEAAGMTVLRCDCRSGRGVNGFAPLLKKKLSDVLERRREKGTDGRALRVMVVGIPNVGKSSFINRMAKSKKTRVGDTPGVTRGKQWVYIDSEVELLDMPGILWHKFDDGKSALLLAYTGAIKDTVMDTEELAFNLGQFLLKEYPENLKERYRLEETGGNILESIAMSRGMLISGGGYDTARAAMALLDDYRGGRIGKITLEKPKAKR